MPADICLPLKIIGFISGHLGQLTKPSRDFGIIVALQLRQQLETQPVPRTIRQGIGTVKAWLKLLLNAPLMDLSLRQTQKRPDNMPVRPALRADSCQSVCSCAAQDTHKHGLGLIVSMMGRRQQLKLLLLPCCLQKGITQAPGCLFQRITG